MKHIISTDKIELNAQPINKYEAIQLAGSLLVKGQHVTEDYIEKMLEREELVTTYIGNYVAIPHGTEESKQSVLSTGISIVQVPNGVDFGGGNIAKLIIGIAAIGDEHLEVLSNIAIVCSDEDNVKKLLQCTTKEEILSILEGEV